MSSVLRVKQQTSSKDVVGERRERGLGRFATCVVFSWTLREDCSACHNEANHQEALKKKCVLRTPEESRTPQVCLVLRCSQENAAKAICLTDHLPVLCHTTLHELDVHLFQTVVQYLAPTPPLHTDIKSVQDCPRLVLLLHPESHLVSAVVDKEQLEPTSRSCGSVTSWTILEFDLSPINGDLRHSFHINLPYFDIKQKTGPRLLCCLGP